MHSTKSTFSSILDSLDTSREKNIDWHEVPPANSHSNWLQQASDAVHKFETPDERSRALSSFCFAKDQLELVQKYTRICNRLEKYGNKLCSKEHPLVPVTFPVKPLPNTRVSMAEGISRSYATFCRQLHEQTLEVSMHRLEATSPAAMCDLVEFVRKISGCLWEEMQKIVDEQRTEVEARVRIVAECAKFSEKCISAERKRLGSVLNHIDALYVALIDFRDNRMLKDRKVRAHTVIAKQAKVVRLWIRGLVRRGWGGCLETFLARSAVANEIKGQSTGVARIQEAFRCVHRDSDEDRRVFSSDEWVSTVYKALEIGLHALTTVCTIERDAIDCQLKQPSSHESWCSLEVLLDSPEVAARAETPVLIAPGHLATFARGRLRIVAAQRQNDKLPACGVALRLHQNRRTELAGVRLCRSLAALLEDGHLFLDKLGCDYANRIVICEYTKYERAVLRVETETLQPFGELINVPYRSSIPDLATARRTQAQARGDSCS